MRNAEDSELRHLLEGELARCVPSTLPGFVREPIEYCLSRPAKRLRALTTLHACALMGSPVERALPAAIAVELLHNFTLVHDDLMDGDVERRGAPSVHARFGNARALLSGDALLALSVSALSSLEPSLCGKALPLFSVALTELCHGQADDHELEGAPHVEVAAYMEVARRKTGALFGLACSLGGICAAATAQEVRALDEFGSTFGIAYQLRDDWRDYFAEASMLGRRPGSDHRRQKTTSVGLLSRTEMPLAIAGAVVPFELERQRLRGSGVHRKLAAEIQKRQQSALIVLRQVKPDAETSALWRLAQQALDSVVSSGLHASAAGLNLAKEAG